MPNNTKANNNGPVAKVRTLADIDAAIAACQDQVKSLRARVKALKEKRERVKAQNATNKKLADAVRARAQLVKKGLDGGWLELPGAGIALRDVLALHQVVSGITLNTLGKELGVGARRAGQIRDRALRKLRHPSIIGLATSLGPEIEKAVYGEMGADAYHRRNETEINKPRSVDELLKSLGLLGKIATHD